MASATCCSRRISARSARDWTRPEAVPEGGGGRRRVHRRLPRGIGGGCHPGSEHERPRRPGVERLVRVRRCDSLRRRVRAVRSRAHGRCPLLPPTLPSLLDRACGTGSGGGGHLGHGGDPLLGPEGGGPLPPCRIGPALWGPPP